MGCATFKEYFIHMYNTTYVQYNICTIQHMYTNTLGLGTKTKYLHTVLAPQVRTVISHKQKK